MTVTADIYEIAVVIIALTFLVLVIVAIPMLMQLKRTIRAVEELSTESRKTIEVLNVLFKKTGDHAGDIDELVKRVKEVGLKATGIAEVLLDSIKNPLIAILSMLLGIEFGMKRLVKKEKKGDSEDVK
jgi:uncharacterized protein YoxC